MGERAGRLTLELLEAPGRLRPRQRTLLEWIEPLGLARAEGRIDAVFSQPAPTIEVALTAAPELIQRRDQVRVQATLGVAVWTPREPTEPILGTTIDLSGGGARLQLPGLPETATRLTVRIDLPSGSLTTEARIIRREAPAIIAVAFDRIQPDDQARLIAFTLERRQPDS